MSNVLIVGAAGRDFHNFNVVFRNNEKHRVVAFTAAQIPGIAHRRYPAELAGPLYPEGIPILPEEELELAIRDRLVDVVVFSATDLSHPEVMHLASRAVAAGADFWMLGEAHTQLLARVPVVSVCAVRTGCGKSPISRRVAALLKEMGRKVVVVRHPMPYGNLAAQAVQRFATLDDLHRHHATVEQREEYEPHLAAGFVVYAGADYAAILSRAETEGDVILWDGGNNDTPFFRSDLEIVVVDPHRPGHESGYFPGEVNLRRARVVVINKVDTAPASSIEAVRAGVRRLNPFARIVETASPVSVEHPEQIAGKDVLVVEDGPTLTHGGMTFGAGVVAARHYGAAAMVDPRPHAAGSIRETFARYPLLAGLLPIMGYSEAQCGELEETINQTPCDLVLMATPADVAPLLRLNKPCLRVSYEIEERSTLGLREILAEHAAKWKPPLAA